MRLMRSLHYDELTVAATGYGVTPAGYPQTLVIVELTVVLCATKVRGWGLIQGQPAVLGHVF